MKRTILVSILMAFAFSMAAGCTASTHTGESTMAEGSKSGKSNDEGKSGKSSKSNDEGKSGKSNHDGHDDGDQGDQDGDGQ